MEKFAVHCCFKKYWNLSFILKSQEGMKNLSSTLDLREKRYFGACRGIHVTLVCSHMHLQWEARLTSDKRGNLCEA